MIDALCNEQKRRPTNLLFLIEVFEIGEKEDKRRHETSVKHFQYFWIFVLGKEKKSSKYWQDRTFKKGR